MIIFVVIFLFAVVVQQYHYCQAQHNRHNNKLFYIYDSAEWAKVANLSIAKRELNERMDSAFNGGAGAIIDENGGAFHTDQYQLFSMIFYRALKDFRRTLDPSKATSFIIPYDFASDALYHKQKCSGDQCHDLRKCPKASIVEALLRESEWFRRHNGKDHLLLVGTNYAMHHYNFKPKCKSLLLTCGNCTKFAIDDYSFMYSGNAGIDAQGDYWHSAPFPADFHWTRKVQRPFPWENRDRPVLMSYIGSDKSFYGPARRLRGSIIHYCNLHRDHCTLQSYGAKGTRQSSNVEGHKPLKLSQRSVFCFQPIGDLMTRKGLFDSLLQGCIPVVFDPLTASVMYTWHWEEAFWREISVELPFHPVAYRYMDPVLFLLNLTQSDTTGRVSRMQELIRSRVFELQYSLDALEEVYLFNSSLRYVTLMQHNRSSNHSADRTAEHTLQYKEVTYESLMSAASSDAGVKSNVTIESNSDHTVVKSTHTVDTWPVYADGTRMRDAYDICIDLMLGWHSGERVRFRNATVPECWDGWLDTVANKCIPGEEPKVKSVIK